MSNLTLATKFQTKTNSNTSINDNTARTITLNLFEAASKDIAEAMQHCSAQLPHIMKQLVHLFGSTYLTLDEFRSIFSNASICSEVNSDARFAALKDHFNQFYNALSKEQQGCFSDEWKGLVGAAGDLFFQIHDLEMVLLPLTLMAYGEPCDDIDSPIDSDKWMLVFTKDVICHWLLRDSREIQVQKIMLLLNQKIALQMQDFNFHLDYSIFDQELLIEAVVFNLLNIETLDHTQANEQAREVHEIILGSISTIPNELYDRIFSHPKLNHWKENVNLVVAEFFGTLFNYIDSQKRNSPTSIEKKKAIARAFTGQNEFTRVMEEYWGCEPTEPTEPTSVLRKFPKIGNKDTFAEQAAVFLDLLSTKTPHINLAMFLRVVHELTMVYNNDKRVVDSTANLTVQQKNLQKKVLDLIFLKEKFDINKVIPNTAIFHLIVRTMFYMYNDTLGANNIICDWIFDRYANAQINIKASIHTRPPQMSERNAHAEQFVVHDDHYFNPQYWYDNDDVHLALQKEQVRHLSHRKGRQIEVLAPFSLDFGTEIASDMLKVAFDEIAKKCDGPTVVVVPFESFSHWIACVLEINTKNKVFDLHHLDSLYANSNENKQKLSEFQKLFNQVFRDIPLLTGMAVKPAPQKRILKQRDGSSCGAFLVQNIVNIVYKSENDRVVLDENGVRAAHIELLGPQFSRKQRANKLSGSVERLSNDLQPIFYECCHGVINNQTDSATQHTCLETFFEFAPALDCSLSLSLSIAHEIYKDISNTMTQVELLEHIKSAEFSIGMVDVLKYLLDIKISNALVAQHQMPDTAASDAAVATHVQEKKDDQQNSDALMKKDVAHSPSVNVQHADSPHKNNQLKAIERINSNIDILKELAVNKSENRNNPRITGLNHLQQPPPASEGTAFLEGLKARDNEAYQNALDFFALTNLPHGQYAAAELNEFHLKNRQEAVRHYLNVYNLNKKQYNIVVTGESPVLPIGPNDNKVERSNEFLTQAKKLNPEALYQLALFYKNELALPLDQRCIIATSDQLSLRITACLKVAANLYHPHAAFLLVTTTLLPIEDRLRYSRIAADPDTEKSKASEAQSQSTTTQLTYRNHTTMFKLNLQLDLGKGIARELLTQVPISFAHIEGLFAESAHSSGSSLLPEKHQPTSTLTAHRLNPESSGSTELSEQELRERRVARFGK